MNFETKLERFVEHVQSERREYYDKRFPMLVEAAQKRGAEHYVTVEAQDGRRFVRIVETKADQKMPYAFVEKKTGKVFGVKSWKAHNPNRLFGTLDTIDEWNWGGVYITHKEGKDSLVPVDQR